jgi:ubiquinone/menaquinone biosynthesis C-methylase UbiE
MGSTTITDTTPDYAAITARQKQVWGTGDYAVVGTRIQIMSETLCDVADLRSGTRVLDVAGGSGNTALAAARSGARVVSLDYVPSLLERARVRAAAEGLDIELVEGDAQALPFADASFDAVVSVVGVMFAPNQRRVADELLRVCRAGGTIALANWTPKGFIGGLFRTIGAHVPPPAGVAPPPLWGSEEHVRELFGDRVSQLRARRRDYTFRFDSAEQFTEVFREYYGPTVAAFSALTPDGREALAADMTALARRFDRLGGDGPVAIPAEYLEVVATRA